MENSGRLSLISLLAHAHCIILPSSPSSETAASSSSSHHHLTPPSSTGFLFALHTRWKVETGEGGRWRRKGRKEEVGGRKEGDDRRENLTAAPASSLSCLSRSPREGFRQEGRRAGRKRKKKKRQEEGEEGYSSVPLIHFQQHALYMAGSCHATTNALFSCLLLLPLSCGAHSV